MKINNQSILAENIENPTVDTRMSFATTNIKFDAIVTAAHKSSFIILFAISFSFFRSNNITPININISIFKTIMYAFTIIYS